MVPTWCVNLRARPQAQVETGPLRHRVRAQVAMYETMDRLWQAFVRVHAAYDEHQHNTQRRIPLTAMRPV